MSTFLVYIQLTYKKVSIPEGTYKFFGSGEDTILGMIMEALPSWRVGSVPQSIANKYRTFDQTNENVYNFMKGEVQESFNCIFDFDTMTRMVYVRDINEEPAEKAVFISTDNLAKEIELEENTEDIVTRLDVNGAEGVDIRDVNPTGTNKLICLDYFMTRENFDQALIDKYFAWKALCDKNRRTYYDLSVRYGLNTMRSATEQAKLADLQGELTGIENEQAVTIQAISLGLETQAALDEVNARIRSKKAEIAAKQAEIDAIAAESTEALGQLKAITETCAFERYFTGPELLQMDRYIKDGELSESSFVAPTATTYNNSGDGSKIANGVIGIRGAEITETADTLGNVLYDIRGGSIGVGGDFTGNIISAVVEIGKGNKFAATVYLGSGTAAGNIFPTACMSVTGNYTSFTTNISTGTITATVNGFTYFTLDATEYEKRSIGWELYEFGEEAMERLAYPTYTFNIESANFLALDEFEYFKNQLELGQKVYLQIADKVNGTNVSLYGNKTLGMTDVHTIATLDAQTIRQLEYGETGQRTEESRKLLKPICIGASFNFGELPTLELHFGDSYVANDATFRLVDLLDKSVSMGKNVELSKYIYSAFHDSGADSQIKQFMDSALDTAKNAILSSTNQAISWDGAGLRLRKYLGTSRTEFEPEQIWMSNNSIMMTDDGWNTAKMAIGKFHDENAGDCWGIIAPMIVGTVLAGRRLIIESDKKEGGTAVFRMDGDGCKLFNTDFEISRTVGGVTTQIVLNPGIGIAIGGYPLYSVDAAGNKTLDASKAKFWADDNGNLHLIGALTATSLFINTDSGDKSADEYVKDIASDISDADIEELQKTLKDEIDGKSTVFWGDTDLSGAQLGDIWYDTAHGKIFRYNGTKWDDITTDALKEALDSASSAKAVADGKIRSYTSDNPPVQSPETPLTLGDLWIDTNENNTLYRWNGTSWVKCQDTHLDYLIDTVDGKTTVYYNSTDPITDPSIKHKPEDNDLWYDIDDGTIKRRTGNTWEDVTDQMLAKALTEARTAKSTADKKIQSFAQNEPPEKVAQNLDIGDLWIDTNENNTLYRWNGTSWVKCQDTHLDDTVKQKAKVFQQATRPTSGYNVGDIWLNTTNNRQSIAVKVTGAENDWVLISVGMLSGTSLSIDPDSGVVTMLAGKKMTIASGGTLELAGSNRVTIGSGGEVAMVGSTIKLNTTSGATAVTLSSSGITVTSGSIVLSANGILDMSAGGRVNISGSTGSIDLNRASRSQVTAYRGSFNEIEIGNIKWLPIIMSNGAVDDPPLSETDRDFIWARIVSAPPKVSFNVPTQTDNELAEHSFNMNHGRSGKDASGNDRELKYTTAAKTSTLSGSTFDYTLILPLVRNYSSSAGKVTKKNMHVQVTRGSSTMIEFPVQDVTVTEGGVVNNIQFSLSGSSVNLFSEALKNESFTVKLWCDPDSYSVAVKMSANIEISASVHGSSGGSGPISQVTPCEMYYVVLGNG